MLNILQPYVYNFCLTRVIDGDTIVGDIDLGFKMKMFDQHLRLYGINTPEIRGSQREQGLFVKEFVISILTSDVPIVITSKGKDSFGRVLSNVYYGENLICLNQVLLSLGMAVPF